MVFLELPAVLLSGDQSQVIEGCCLLVGIAILKSQLQPIITNLLGVLGAADVEEKIHPVVTKPAGEGGMGRFLFQTEGLLIGLFRVGIIPLVVIKSRKIHLGQSLKVGFASLRGIADRFLEEMLRRTEFSPDLEVRTPKVEDTGKSLFISGFPVRILRFSKR